MFRAQVEEGPSANGEADIEAGKLQISTEYEKGVLSRWTLIMVHTVVY